MSNKLQDFMLTKGVYHVGDEVEKHIAEYVEAETSELETKLLAVEKENAELRAEVERLQKVVNYYQETYP